MPPLPAHAGHRACSRVPCLAPAPAPTCLPRPLPCQPNRIKQGYESKKAEEAALLQKSQQILEGLVRGAGWLEDGGRRLAAPPASGRHGVSSSTARCRTCSSAAAALQPHTLARSSLALQAEREAAERQQLVEAAAAAAAAPAPAAAPTQSQQERGALAVLFARITSFFQALQRWVQQLVAGLTGGSGSGSSAGASA